MILNLSPEASFVAHILWLRKILIGTYHIQLDQSTYYTSMQLKKYSNPLSLKTVKTLH